METVCGTLGWSMYTCWKRRSSAGSFSMCLRYSSSVVAPMHLSSPRPSIGLSKLPASIAPSLPAPAPTTVWISSMNSTILPSADDTSLITAFRRSSNSPRNLAPAMSAPMSSENSEQPRSTSGTSPATMRCARPSATAVLPTPGSPMSTGLFLVRRDRMWMHRRTSSSRPITGSSLPSRAACVKSRAYLCSASYLPSGFWSVTICPPRTSRAAASRLSRLSPCACSSLPTPLSRSSATASSKCSTLMNESPHDALMLSARESVDSRWRPRIC
mmetsp:Transcript_37926/g.112276  ORF Transcript_37926/g.112276 Transcript_37926/m.112276 type:complete len:272 (-) Transcript_37926:424-1239(-)